MRDLQADKAICDKATKGPWERNEKPSFGDWWVYVGGQHICLLPADKKGTHFGEMFKANAEFIAQAREGWPHAIGRAIKAETEVERLRNRLSKIEDMCVEFHECGPYQEGEEVKRIMAIYDMAGGIEK